MRRLNFFIRQFPSTSGINGTSQLASRRYVNTLTPARSSSDQGAKNEGERCRWTFPRTVLMGATATTASAFAFSSTVFCEERTVSLGSTADYPEGGTKEVEVDGVKVLVHHYDGEFYCTAAACSHYGYPLKKGVQNRGKGNKGPYLVCALHDATFDLKTGQAQRGPTVDPIEVYPLTIDKKSGNISAAIPQAPLKPKVARRDPKDTSSGIVIIGAGAAGSACADTLRQEGYTGRIQVFTKEAYGFYDRTALTKDLDKAKTPKEKICMRTEEEIKERDIELRKETEVTHVDVEKKVVTYKTKDGKEKAVDYDKILIASGGIPRTLFVQGCNFKNIVTLRTIEDCQKIAESVKKDDKVFIVGGSFIGMEAASSLAKKQANIAMVSMESVPFERVLGKRIGGSYARLLEDQGVEWIGSNKVRLYRGDDKVTGVELDDGEVYPADLVLIGAGIIPQFMGEVSPHGALPVASDGSFKVNPLMQSRGKYADSVYVAGDCATFPSIQRGEDVRIEHWDVAVEQGKTAALNMLGKHVPYTQIPFFWTMSFNKGLRFVGYAPEKFDATIIEGDLAKMEFIAYFVEKDQVIGVATVGRDPLAVCCAEIMRLGLMPPAHEFFMRKMNGENLIQMLKAYNAGKIKK